ncbi:hypothetical protein Tco_0947380 [Tanacetum coccineum]
MITPLWISTKVAYDKDAALEYLTKEPNGNYSLEKDKQFNLEIVVRRANQNEYVFKEVDFPRLHLNDIEDITILKNRIEDVKLGMESYQVKLNITCPQKYLMRDDEWYKFGDGTLKKVRDKLYYMLKNFELGYNKAIPRRAWTDKDQERTTFVLEKIKKTLLTRWIRMSLECYVGGRNIEMDYRLLTQTE